MLCRLIRHRCSFAAHMSPTLNGSTVLQHFERGNVVKILSAHRHQGLIRYGTLSNNSSFPGKAKGYMTIHFALIDDLINALVLATD